MQELKKTPSGIKGLDDLDSCADPPLTREKELGGAAAKPRGGDRWSARIHALLKPLFTMEGTSTF